MLAFPQVHMLLFQRSKKNKRGDVCSSAVGYHFEKLLAVRFGDENLVLWIEHPVQGSELWPSDASIKCQGHSDEL